MLKPTAASTTSHSSSNPTLGVAGGAGQSGNMAIVRLSASTTRTGCGAPDIPGIGTKMKAPETRASTIRNANTPC